MKKNLRVLSMVLVLVMAVVLVNGCGKAGTTASTSTSTSSTAASTTPDTVTALLPPISNDFLGRVDKIEAAFHEKYPNLTLQIEAATWNDNIEKLDTQVNAGTPPDIAFLGSENVAKYVDMGMAMDITKYATKEMIADYDAAPLEYMKNGNGLYGLPAYMEIHGIGGNKEYMEAAGIDWKKIQTTGWTFDEFRAAAKKGIGVKGSKSTSKYGFVFATTGSTTKNFVEIFAKNAGMPSDFTSDYKYAYTSKKFLDVLTEASTLISDGANMNASAGERWNLFLTGQTMFTGKGLATFENSAKTNNAKLKANDGSAVQGSVPVDYVVMPVPTTDGAKPSYYAVVDGYVCFRGKKAPTDEHMSNVAKAAYFLASGSVSAQTNADLFAVNITKSARDAESQYPISRDADNLACVKYLMANAAPARPDIPSSKLAQSTKIMTEVIVPKFQALLAKEITPQQMYDAVHEAAVAAFGKDGVVVD